MSVVVMAKAVAVGNRTRWTTKVRGRVQTATPEELLEQISQIEADIRELLDYSAEVNLHKRSVKGWQRFVASLKLLLVARQIRRHLVYLKLQRRIAQDSYDELINAEGKKLV